MPGSFVVIQKSLTSEGGLMIHLRIRRSAPLFLCIILPKAVIRSTIRSSPGRQVGYRVGHPNGAVGFTLKPYDLEVVMLEALFGVHIRSRDVAKISLIRYYDLFISSTCPHESMKHPSLLYLNAS